MPSISGHLGEAVTRHAKKMATELALGQLELHPHATVLRVQHLGKPRRVEDHVVQETAR